MGTRPDFADALLVLRLRKWSVIAVTILVVGLALLATSQQQPIYQSEAAVVVLPVAAGQNQALVAEPNMATEEELAESVAVATLVVEDLDLDVSPEDFLVSAGADNPLETEILRISYRHTSPREAARRAQALAEGYLDYRRAAVNRRVQESAEASQREIEVLREQLNGIEAELRGLGSGDPARITLASQAQLLQNSILQRQLDQLELPDDTTVGTVVHPATPSDDPASPNVALNGSFALVAGLGLGIALAFLRERLAGRLRSPEDVEEYAGAGVLAAIPRVKAWRRRKDAFLITRSDWRSPATEGYRVLRTNVLSAAMSGGLKSFVVTSPQTGEGKSTTVANLGMVLARAGKNVIIVSSDLRRPRLHQFFNAATGPGVTDILARRATVEQSLIKLGGPAQDVEGVRLLPSGTPPEHPAELLASGDLNRLVAELEASADFVIFDTAPVLPVTDALILAPLVGGVILVLSTKSTTEETVTQARQQLDKVGARIMGIVLNAPEPSMTDTYGPY